MGLDPAPSACPTPGCPGLVQYGHKRCPECERGQAHSHNTRAAKRLYNSAAWQRIRRAVLADEPVCRMCGRAPASVVDHIDGNYRNIQRKNLQGLCKPCHDRKTAEHNGAFGR